MMILSIVLLILFCVMICIIEIPKMLKDRLYRELFVFLLLLVCGFITGILKSFNLAVPNPADWVAAIYSPFADLMINFGK